jgi:hypothetical protein
LTHVAAEPQTLQLDVDGRQFLLDRALKARAGILMGRFDELYPIREAATQGELRFGFLFNVKPFDTATERLVCGVIGKSVKASPVWRDLVDLDAIVWVRKQVWDLFDDDSRDALLLHLLLHFDAAFVKGTWKLSTRDHDYAGFNDVARHFGSALPDTAAFVRALQRGEGPAEDQGDPVSFEDIASAVGEALVEGAASGELGENVTVTRDVSRFNGLVLPDETLQAAYARLERRGDFTELIESDAGQLLLRELGRIRDVAKRPRRKASEGEA